MVVINAPTCIDCASRLSLLSSLLRPRNENAPKNRLKARREEKRNETGR